MKQIILLLAIGITTQVQAQMFQFQFGNNPCQGYFNPGVQITYMPQTVYMRPYQQMPAPQPVIITPVYPAFTPTIPFTPYAAPMYYNNRNCR